MGATRAVLAALSVGLAGIPADLAAQELIFLAPTGTHATARANAVSADGAVVVGTLGEASISARGFVWTGTGVGNVGGIADGNSFDNWFTANGVSGDGAAIVGAATAPMLPAATAGRHAYIWTEVDGFSDLGTLGGLISEAWGISSDGTVVVGTAYDDEGRALGFRWTAEGGMVGLGMLDGQTSASANAASADGSVVVGTADAGGMKAFQWTADGGLVALPTIVAPDWATVTPYARASDVSDDGRVIAGSSGVYQTVAVRWVDGGLHELGSIANAYGASEGMGISGNGTVIVGRGQDATYTYRAFRWTEVDGMETVEDWLRGDGATIAADVTAIARATNCDGSVVVGDLTNGQAFVARGVGTGSCDGGDGFGDPDPEDTDPEDPDSEDPPDWEPGLIGLDDLDESLTGAANANVGTAAGLGLMLNGAGSRPLDRVGPEGRVLAWVGGDLGLDGQSGSEGTVGLGEVGFGYNFGALQFNAAIGLTGGHYDTPYDGTTDLLTTFVKVEAMGMLYPTDLGGVWGIITGTGLIGTADMERRYLANGGLVESSYGEADLGGFGVRGRLQWENMVQNVSPYGELAFGRACVGAYTEGGGPFPASFDELCSDAIDLRLGVDVKLPLNDQVRLTGTLEAVHRLAGDKTTVSGDVAGIGSFAFDAPTGEATWVRAGLGFEADLGGATLSTMGNLTTQGGSPNAWVAASLKASF